jgi:hypothetical protein
MTDAVQTNSTAAEILGALQEAGVSRNAAIMLAAQSALETNGWNGGMWNFNLGDITTNGPYYVLQPGLSLPFKAYGSLQEGATDFVQYIRSHGLMPFAESGDLQGYVDRLQAFGYAGPSANYTNYYNGMARWLKQLGAVAPAPRLKTNSFLIAAVAGGLAWGLYTGAFERAFRKVWRWLPV